MGSKKRVVRKRIQKRLQKKKDVKHSTPNDVKDKLKQAIGGGMSKLEYQQNLLDPKFRAAMVGFGGFPIPQSGMSNANQYLQEHREKNNELSRKIALEQDMAKLKQENSSLKLKYREQKQKTADDFNKLKQEQQKEFYEKQVEREKQISAEKMEYQKKLSMTRKVKFRS